MAKSAIITGCATGIGRALALALPDAGYLALTVRQCTCSWSARPPVQLSARSTHACTMPATRCSYWTWTLTACAPR